MIYSKDNFDVFINKRTDDFGFNLDLALKAYKIWLRERNIKFSLVYIPEWATYPTHINLRNEDAIAFKLRFGL